MTYIPEPQEQALLTRLFEQIERAWYSRSNPALVDQLATDNPRHADALYDFYILLAKSDLEIDRPRPEFAEEDAARRAWLEREGFARAGLASKRSAASGASSIPSTPAPASPEATASPDEAAIAGDSRHLASEGPTRRVALRGGAPGSAPGPETRDSPGRSADVGHTFLGLLRRETQLSTVQIADGLGVDVDFLVAADELGESLPARAREEFARRAESRFGVYGARSWPYLAHANDFAIAASRTAPYGRRRTYESVVSDSRMSAEQKALWLSFANQPRADQ